MLVQEHRSTGQGYYRQPYFGELGTLKTAFEPVNCTDIQHVLHLILSE